MSAPDAETYRRIVEIHVNQIARLDALGAAVKGVEAAHMNDALLEYRAAGIQMTRELRAEMVKFAQVEVALRKVEAGDPSPKVEGLPELSVSLSKVEARGHSVHRHCQRGKALLSQAATTAEMAMTGSAATPPVSGGSGPKRAGTSEGWANAPKSSVDSENFQSCVSKDEPAPSPAPAMIVGPGAGTTSTEKPPSPTGGLGSGRQSSPALIEPVTNDDKFDPSSLWRTSVMPPPLTSVPSSDAPSAAQLPPWGRGGPATTLKFVSPSNRMELRRNSWAGYGKPTDASTAGGAAAALADVDGDRDPPTVQSAGPLQRSRSVSRPSKDQAEKESAAAKSKTLSGGLGSLSLGSLGSGEVDAEEAKYLSMLKGSKTDDERFVAISVSEPRIMSSGSLASSSYTVYSVVGTKGTGPQVEAERRYSDFRTLRKVLCKQYPALKRVLPDMPEKKLFGNKRASFVEKRRAGLQEFLKAAIEIQGEYHFVARFLHKFFFV